MAGGGLELFYGPQAHTLTGTWFWPAGPGPHIRFHPAPGHLFWVHRYVAYKGPLAARWNAAGLQLSAPQQVARRAHYVALFDALLEQAQRPTRWAALRAANLLERVLLELAEERAQPAARETWLEIALERLGAAESAPDYPALSAELNMGLSTLRRKFRQATGSALHAYALQCRTQAARNLLGDSDLPIKTIAERLGYRDVYFFSRQFRQLTGISPAAYRRSRQ